MMWLVLVACPAGPAALTLSAPEAVDECVDLCVAAVLTRGGVAASDEAVTIAVEGATALPGTTDEHGRVELCFGGLELGAHAVSATSGEATATGTVAVRSFGFADGLERNEDPLDTLPWTPSFTRAQVGPVLAPGEPGGWDGVAVALPSLAPTDDGFVMWYAGSDGGDYVVGAATSPDGVEWNRDAANPLVTGSGAAGDWKRYSVNSPMIVEVGEEWALLYDGRAEETGNINIGLATGASPLAVADVATEPVFRWTEAEEPWGGRAVAHPGVLVNRQGFWEMWYSTGLQKIGYAYSADGRSWTRYCRNPVFAPDPESSWENGTVKAAEVFETADGYAMTYSGGGMGTFQVGWAMSHDGLRWQRAPEPVLAPGTEAWEARSVLSAPTARVGDELWMWYTGTDGVGSSIGLAKAEIGGGL